MGASVSDLMRYLGALGANLELRVVFPDRTVRLYFLENTDGSAMEPPACPEPLGQGTQDDPRSSKLR